jgi:hypothetical protein
MQLSRASGQVLAHIKDIPYLGRQELLLLLLNIRKTLAVDPVYLDLRPTTVYVATADRADLTVCRQDVGDQQVLCYISIDAVTLFRLPDIASLSPHQRHELQQAATASLSAGDAILDGLSSVGIEITKRGHLVLRISPGDNCHWVGTIQDQVVGSSNGLHWSYYLALLLKGYRPEQWMVPHLQQLVQMHPPAIRGAVASLDFRKAHDAFTRIQEYVHGFDFPNEQDVAQHDIALLTACPADLAQAAVDHPIGSSVLQSLPLSGHAQATIKAAQVAHGRRGRIAVTLVLDPHQTLYEVWVEDLGEDDGDL